MIRAKLRAHGLLDPEQDDQPTLTDLNADSYVWMSLESFISSKCVVEDNDPALFVVEDPPPYDDSGSDDSCSSLEESSSESSSDDEGFGLF